MDISGSLHVLAAGCALALGSAVAVAPKGTARHRNLGRAYGVAMIVLNLTALAIYDLSGRPNAFHALALLSLFTLAAGWWIVRAKPDMWRRRHARTMLWSYVGLLAAAASELIVRVPNLIASWLAFGVAVGMASVAVCMVGWYAIERTVARIR